MDTSVKPDEEEEFPDSSSDSSILSEEWQDLSKSDFAKVIFCDINYDAENNTVGCKFQITDNVHEDPCDYVGLFKIGKSQCFVSKMLSETECEEDGKLLRCNFSDDGLPDGYYHFQYVTRDGEVCGASTPVEVKRLQPKEELLDKKLAVEAAEKKFFLEDDLKEDSSDEDVVTENAENDFVVVEHILEKKNRMLEELLEKFRAKNLALSSDMEVLLEAKSKLCQEKEEVIEHLELELISLRAELARKNSTIMEKDSEIKCLSSQVQSSEQAMEKYREDLDTMAKLLDKCEQDKLGLHNEVLLLKEFMKEKDNRPLDPEHILLEQLEDQKFMIRALEDSKHLALKEMSDLSESLSKRTKVLNQTRSELASCKLKLKESDSVVEKQKVHIGKLIKKLDDLNNFEKHSSRDAKPACRNKDEIDLSKPVQELYAIAITRAEKFLVLVDTLIAKTNFREYFQEKSFHRLKIMFFVLLGKMRKPKDLIRSREGSSNSSPERNDVKKTVSRMLPSHLGHTSADCLDLNLAPVVYSTAAREESIAPLLTNTPKVSGYWMLNCMQYLSHEYHKMRCNKINEILKAGMPNVDEEDFTFFKELWNGYNERPKSLIEKGADVTEYEVNDPITVLMTLSTRKEMKRLEAMFDVVDHEIGVNGKKQSAVNELFIDVLRQSMKIEILLRYIEKVYKETSSEEKEKLKKKYEESNIEVMNLTKEVAYLKDKVEDLSSKLMEADSSYLSLKADIVKKDEVIEYITEQKITLMEREIALHAIVKEHEARIKEAAELYKTMYLEMDKLKKKLRRAKMVKTKVVIQECSTVEGVSQLKTRELCDVPFKRARKTTSKYACAKSTEKATGSKAANQQPQVVEVKPFDKQPQMLKEISLKSFSQNAEKACSKSFKKPSPSKALKKSPAANAKASATLEALIREKFPMNLDNLSPAFAVDQPDCQLPQIAKGSTFSDLPECVSSSNGKQPRKSTPTKCAKAATRCVSDSDTGEHVLRNTSVSSIEGDKPMEKKQKSVADNSKVFGTLSDEKPTISPIIEYFKSLDERPSSPDIELDAFLEPGDRDLRSVHKLLKMEITKAFSPAPQNEDKFYIIPCALCTKSLKVTEDLANLMDHLESEHQISMCPMCGQLFEASFPKKYLLFHVEDHFKSE